MSGDPGRRAAHFDLVARATRGALTATERAALVVLLERVQVATELTEEEGPRAGWWTRVVEAQRTLLAAVDVPEPRASAGEVVGGADVHRLRAR